LLLLAETRRFFLYFCVVIGAHLNPTPQMQKCAGDGDRPTVSLEQPSATTNFYAPWLCDTCLLPQ